MATNHDLSWSRKNTGALVRTDNKDAMSPDEAAASELAAEVDLSDLKLDLSFDDIVADLQYGRD